MGNKSLILIAALILVLTIFVSVRDSSEACCDADFRESSYSMTFEQLEDFGWSVIGYNRIHIAPIAFVEGVMRISMCESTYRPEAVSPTGCLGLMQLCRDSAMLRVVHGLGYQWRDMLDADNNLEVAIWWWRITGRNFSAWECT